MSPVILQVRELREAAGLTQAQVSAKTGIALGTLSRIENGHSVRIELDTIDKLSRAFGVEPGALFVRTRR